MEFIEIMNTVNSLALITLDNVCYVVDLLSARCTLTYTYAYSYYKLDWLFMLSGMHKLSYIDLVFQFVCYIMYDFVCSGCYGYL